MFVFSPRSISLPVCAPTEFGKLFPEDNGYSLFPRMYSTVPLRSIEVQQITMISRCTYVITLFFVSTDTLNCHLDRFSSLLYIFREYRRITQ